MHTPMLCDAWLTFPLMAALVWNDPSVTCTPGQLHLLTCLHYANRSVHIPHQGWRRHPGTRALVGMLTVSHSARTPLTWAVVFLWQLRSVKPHTSRYGLSKALYHRHTRGLLAGFQLSAGQPAKGLSLHFAILCIRRYKTRQHIFWSDK